MTRQAGRQKVTRNHLYEVHCPIYVYPMDTHQLTSPQGEADVQSLEGL